MTCLVAPQHGPGWVGVPIAIGLMLEVWIVGAIFGYGVARESKSRLVKITGYLLALPYLDIPAGLIFIYGVARESKSRLVMITGHILAVSVAGMVVVSWEFF